MDADQGGGRPNEKGKVDVRGHVHESGRRVWTYNDAQAGFWAFSDMQVGFWRLTDEFEDGGGSMRFKLTDGRQKTFAGRLLAEFEEWDIVQLQDILLDATNLEFNYGYWNKESSVFKFPFSLKMFLDVIQMAESSAPVLQYLVAQRCETEVLGRLISCLKFLGGIRVLDLSFSRFEGRHLALAHAMESGHLEALEILVLKETNIGIADCEAYGKALESGRVGGLTRIDIQKNKIGEYEARALKHAFKSGHVKNLRDLFLEHNNLGDDGMIELSSALKSGHMRNLSTISLGWNQVSDVGLFEMAKAFRSGEVQNLRTIDLQSNPFGDDGMVELASSLEVGKFKDLQVLNFRGTLIGLIGISRLARALESGNLNSLTHLYLPTLNYNATENNEIFKSFLQAVSRNSLLTCLILFGWEKNQQIMKQRGRNLKLSQLLSAAGGREVPATSGKVYMCGNPEVGKTTLRRTLQRTKFQALYTRERRKHVERRTRGIDVHQISSEFGHGQKEVTLALWDMAGQHDYHLVHNAFLPDLAYSEGKATIFVVMCSSNTQISKAEKELENWFNFIASSVNETSPNLRDVVVVVNHMDGESVVLSKAAMHEWKCMLSVLAQKFQTRLKIGPDPFLIDVRVRECVQEFKRSLFERIRDMLEGVKVPKICHNIQSFLGLWVQERKHFPVLPWYEVQKELRKSGADWPEETLEAAFKYLNEAGVLIFIEKKFPEQLHIPEEKLVVADPKWLCKEILGNMFLPEGMGVPANSLFRAKVDPNKGSIPISEFMTYFTSLEGACWYNSEPDHLLAILLWLGICFKGGKDNIFIPALISEDDEKRKREVFWDEGDPLGKQTGQWIMGFSVEHVPNETALPPMALWHRFEVELAQIQRFNGQTIDNDFLAGKYFTTFKVENMIVLIQVNANESVHPTFDRIEVLVKPLWNLEKDVVAVNSRKQFQVDIANEVVEKLVGLWDEVCPGIGYVQRIVWPFPVSQLRPPPMKEKNVEVAKLRNDILTHGGGRQMHWKVGDHGIQDIVIENQLLSTKDNEFLEGCKAGRSVGRSFEMFESNQSRELGVKQRSGYTVMDEEMFSEMSTMQKPEHPVLDELNHEVSTKRKYKENVVTQVSSQTWGRISTFNRLLFDRVEETLMYTRDIRKSQKEIQESQDQIQVGQREIKESQIETQEIREISQTLKTHLHQVFLKVEDFERSVLEDKQSTCPKIMYVGEQKSSLWMRLANLRVSPLVHVHLHFLCEANYKDGEPHPVTDQEGIDVSYLADWARNLPPWVTYYLNCLLKAAKISANFVAPGFGWPVPNFIDWEQASSLADGISAVTGFTEKELDGLMTTDVRPGLLSTVQNPEVLYGQSRKAMAEILGRLTVQEKKENLGLQKVLLRSMERSLMGVRWICEDCFQKYLKENRVVEL